MSTEFKQSLRQDQSLAITPQLKRSLEILQAGALELRDIVDAELNTNPLLEELSNVDKSERPQTIGENPFPDDDFDDDTQSSAQQNNDAQKTKDFVLNSIPDKLSLQEYLLTEANLDAKNESVAKAFVNLTGSLDERGFLLPDAIANAKANGFDEKSINEALELLRESEPSGIGAFDMRDSLMLQLEHKQLGNSLAYRILELHYNLLMKRKVEDIAKIENRSTAEVENAIAEIAKLKTSPASDFENQAESYILPDIIFSQTPDGDWVAELSRENYPRLQINQEYRKMAMLGKLRAEEQAYIKEKIRDGKLIMDAIEMRQKTLQKIANAILAKQQDFFENGIDALKPMTMQDIADLLDIHATTVGRAIAEKYAQTPFGLFPLKIFFSGGYESESGENISSKSIKNKIAQMIEDESTRSPLSDSKIAEILSSEGITIARRTVAKYREELGIAPKNLRKRY